MAPKSIASIGAAIAGLAAGYPVGGSLEFSRCIEHRYLDLGGQNHYSSAVEKILVEYGHAVGVRLVDGSERCSDLTISAADGHATIFKMLDGTETRNDTGRKRKRSPTRSSRYSTGVIRGWSARSR